MTYFTFRCKRKDYDILSRQKDEIIKRTIDGFNDEWKPRVKDIDFTFLYIPSSDVDVVGIFFRSNRGVYELADSEENNPEQNAISATLVQILREELNMIKLKKGDVSRTK